MQNTGEKGFTLPELMTVIAISGVLMGIAGFSYQNFRWRYEVESQVRQLQADLLNARTRALQGNRKHYIAISQAGYQIIEDTNESNGNEPDEGDSAFWPAPKQLKVSSRWTGTMVMDARGVASLSTGPLLNTGFVIQFDNNGASPEYDCISVRPTRIHTGKSNGSKCALL